MVIASWILSGAPGHAQEQNRPDRRESTVIINAQVADGTGAPLERASVRIVGDRVAGFGTFAPGENERVIDATGLVLAPGFIDMHNHSAEGLDDDPLAETQLAQGITTLLLGPDGSSPWPVGAWLDAREKNPVALNVGLFVGHATVRKQVMGSDYKRAASASEVERMAQLVDEAMREGAVGLSSGLEYEIGSYSKTEEVVALAKVAARHGGFYMTHIRDEADKSFEALKEEIAIAEQAGIPVQHSHIKLATVNVWGKAQEYIRVIEAARERGVDFLADFYPYDAWHTTIKVVVPNKQYEDPESVDQGLADLGGAGRVTIVKFPPNRTYEFHTLEELAKSAGITPVEMYIRVIREGNAAGTDAMVVGQSMIEADVKAFIRPSWVMIASDGGITSRHPRASGTFPRVLGRYVRETRWVTLPEAIRKMTSLPAWRLGWPDRGTIRVGAIADLVLFDPETVIDRATFAKPTELAAGIETVMVNGAIVWNHGRATGARPGRALRNDRPALDRTALDAPRAGDELMAKVDEYVRAEMKDERVPGVAIGIVRNGEVVAAKGYGFANVENRVPVTAETIFQSGSTGKQFTAAAVMLMVEDGKLALDDSITKYFTDAPQSWRPITVRHLLTHTSGITDYTPQDLDFRRDYTEDELAKKAYGLSLEFDAGSRWNYSNTGYVLLGILIHKVSGRFYGDVLADRVFAPLGMKTARVITEAYIVPNRAAGHRLVNGELMNQQWVAPNFNTTADGSLYLSMNDFIAWDRGLRAQAILKPQSWSQIYTPVTLKSGKTYPYGFGWSVEELAGKPWYHHGGTWQGFKAYISRYLADDLTIVVLANLVNANPGRFVDGIATILDPRLAKPEPTTPISDRDPKVTATVRTMLQAASEGTLALEDLPFVRRGIDFPQRAKRYQELLRPLGALQRLDLVELRELGDDRVFTYAAVYSDRTLKVRLALAPGDRISVFDVEPQ